jgi:hypothetical protein
MELFDLIKRIFEDPEGYKEASKLDKRKNFFMINRRFSINHPMQANALNGLRINQEEAIDVWQKFMRKLYNKTPYWMYTKGVKKANEEKEKKINISSAVVQDYAKRNMYDQKSVWDALNLFPEKMVKELQEFEKMSK